MQYANMNLEQAAIVYDDLHQIFTIKNHQIYNNKFLIDNNGNIIKKIFGHNPISDNWEIIQPTLLSVAKNVLKIEKAFGKPQDVEGGIKDGKIYFWQTRDITKYAVEHL
jgi:hypothetical protein